MDGEGLFEAAPRPSEAAHSPSGAEVRAGHDQSLNEAVHALGLRMQRMSTTVDGSCRAILSVALEDLKKSTAASAAALRDAQQELDLTRHDELVAESASGHQPEQTQMAGAQPGQPQWNQPAHATPPRAATLSTAAALASVVGSAASMVASVVVGTSDTRRLAPTATERLGHLRQRVSQLQEAYNAQLTDSKAKMTFALEQCAMSVWSVYNVAFTELSGCFTECAPNALTASTALKALKNDLRVSRKLDDERRARLLKQASENAKRFVLRQRSVSMAPSRTAEAAGAAPASAEPPADTHDAEWELLELADGAASCIPEVARPAATAPELTPVHESHRLKVSLDELFSPESSTTPKPRASASVLDELFASP
jgi:hypothetical protein